MKNLARIFFVSFFTCILTVGTAFGLLFVAETSKNQNGEDMSFSIEKTSPYTLSMSFMGNRRDISISLPEKIADKISDYGTLILPRGARLFLQLGELARRLISGESKSLPEPEYKNACLV